MFPHTTSTGPLNSLCLSYWSCACHYFCPPEPPATDTPSQLPDETPEKTAKEKRKRKKDKERDRAKVENKEDQGTTHGKAAEERPRKTPLHTQPVTGILCCLVLEKHDINSDLNASFSYFNIS